MRHLHIWPQNSLTIILLYKVVLNINLLKKEVEHIEYIPNYKTAGIMSSIVV